MNMNTNTKKILKETDGEYGYYSRLLKQPFDTLDELKLAEEKYYAELKAKEDKAATKKADAQKVEDAFKALNAERKKYKEDLTGCTEWYSKELAKLKESFSQHTSEIKKRLADAETAYKSALKEFTTKYDTYHLSLKDGDFETTIDSQANNKTTVGGVDFSKLADIFDMMFNF